MSGTWLWYANRGTGVVLLALLTLTMVMGVLARSRFSATHWPRFVTQHLHRNVALMSVALLVVHIFTAVVDTYVNIRWFDAFVPFVGTYKALWLGLGTVAFDLILAVTITSLLRDRMSHRPWKAVHFASYAIWFVSVVHGLGIGTDRRTTWGLGTTLACVAAVGVAVVMRVGFPEGRPTPTPIRSGPAGSARGHHSVVDAGRGRS